MADRSQLSAIESQISPHKLLLQERGAEAWKEVEIPEAARPRYSNHAVEWVDNPRISDKHPSGILDVSLDGEFSRIRSSII